MKIYRHILVSPDTIAFPDDISHGGMVIGDTVVPKPYPLCPAVLSACRQLNTEATPVLYSLNTFFLRLLSRNWTAGGELALAKMSPAHRALIQKLELQLWHPHDFIRKTAFIKHKAALPSLATLLPGLDSCTFLFYENFSLKMRGDRDRIREVIEWNVLEAPSAKFVGWDVSFQDEIVRGVLDEVMTRNAGWCYTQSAHWKNHGETVELRRLRSGVPDHEGYKDDTIISRDFGWS